jgi:hypothetical protein
VAWSYLDLADYLLIAEAVLGVPAERLAEMPPVVQVAGSALAVPASGFGGYEAYPEFVQKECITRRRRMPPLRAASRSIRSTPLLVRSLKALVKSCRSRIRRY